MPDNFSKIKQLTSEEESTLEKNLVWIFASPRSGTTWLGLRLLTHNTYFIAEPLIGAHLALYDTNGLKKDFDEFQKRPTRADHYFFAEKYKVAWQVLLKKIIVNRIYLQHQDTTKKIIIKEPHGSFGADIISDCLPNSKIIIIFRDGRDCVDSLVDARSAGGWVQASSKTEPISGESRLSFIRQQAKIWTQLMEVLEKVSKSHPKENLMIIKYEELLKNTLDELRKIYHFLDIQIQEEELKNLETKYSYENIPQVKKGSGKSVRFATPGKWKENFNDEEQILINKIMGKKLKELGYEV